MSLYDCTASADEMAAILCVRHHTGDARWNLKSPIMRCREGTKGVQAPNCKPDPYENGGTHFLEVVSGRTDVLQAFVCAFRHF